MKVYAVVGMDYEHHDTLHICSTKEIAEEIKKQRKKDKTTRYEYKIETFELIEKIEKLDKTGNTFYITT